MSDTNSTNNSENNLTKAEITKRRCRASQENYRTPILKDSVLQLACGCKGILSRHYPLLLPTTSLRLRAEMENNEHKKKLAQEHRREIDAEYREVVKVKLSKDKKEAENGSIEDEGEE
ncbi:hypothetical protein B0H14DRAFT_2556203 [Mycena olivaceomarginata]|nr:hypothetical protein B0H14DRAFT_2556203 [Mycena olivaceomarginata]